MMPTMDNSRMRTAAIILAGASISGALVLLGVMIGREPAIGPIDEHALTSKIRAEISMQRGDREGMEPIDDGRLSERIRTEVNAQLNDRQRMDSLVEAAIVRIVERQQQAQAAAAGKRFRSLRPVSPGRDHIYGNPDAPLSLVEYSDFECPFCKRFHPTAQKIVATYGGKVNWIYRHFPLESHNPGAQQEAEASECAAELGGNDAFWRYADLIYARTRSNGKGFPLEKLVPLAGEIGLDEVRFKDCLESGRMAARVREDLADGQRIGIDGTPGNILLKHKTGEARYRPGARAMEVYKQEIDQMLRDGR